MSCCFLQYVSLPSLHCVQSRHAEICAPTPTRSPTLTVVTLGPTLTAVPTISVGNLLAAAYYSPFSSHREPTMAGNNGPVLVAPSTATCVEIRSANATACYLDIDIVVAERLGLELWF